MSDTAVNSRLVGLFADKKIYAGAIGCFYLIFDTLERELDRIGSTDPRKTPQFSTNRSSDLQQNKT